MRMSNIEFWFKNYEKKGYENYIKFYTNSNIGYIDKKHITKNYELIPFWKVYISSAYGAGEGFPHQILNKPFKVKSSFLRIVVDIYFVNNMFFNIYYPWYQKGQILIPLEIKLKKLYRYIWTITNYY